MRRHSLLLTERVKAYFEGLTEYLYEITSDDGVVLTGKVPELCRIAVRAKDLAHLSELPQRAGTEAYSFLARLIRDFYLEIMRGIDIDAGLTDGARGGYRRLSKANTVGGLRAH